MTPSRLKFTIKMLNVLIIFKNNFFLTFHHLKSVLLKFHVLFPLRFLLFTFHPYNYNTRLSGIYRTLQLINIVIKGGSN